MKHILLLFSLLYSLLGSAQEKVPFNGIVKDVTGNPVKNVRIYVDNPRLYATTDKQGRFGLTDVKPDDVLHVKVRKAEYEIPVQGKKSIVIVVAEDFLLKEAVESQELVDIGYGFVKRREHTLPGNTISGEELVRTGQTNILDVGMGKMEMAGASRKNLKELHAPIIYMTGGEGDVAYRNAEMDYNSIKNVHAVWADNAQAGHGGTYNQPFGGSFGKMVVDWLDLQLKGNAGNAANFIKTNDFYKEWTIKNNGKGNYK